MADPEPPADMNDPWRGGEVASGRVRRAIPLMGLTARTAGEVAHATIRGQREISDDAAFHMRTAERYAEVLGRSKGALMKAGQMLALTQTMPAVPPEFQSVYRTALGRLLTEAPPMEAKLVRAVLERELGARIEHAFAEFVWKPLAAASVGQVHAARLYDGRSVAVKIQYPGVADGIAADLQNMELLSTFLSLVFNCTFRHRLSFDLRGAAREIGRRVTEELDYETEAANQAKFAEHYRGHPFIRVPEVIGELCTERVLTQELVQGLSWHDALAADQELRDQWAEAIWRFVFGSHIRFGLFHGDPHPGNFRFHEDGSVTFLDYGCVKRFSQEYAGMMMAIGPPCVIGDVRGTWRACVEYGVWCVSAPVTPEEMFAYWRNRLEMYWRNQPFTLTPEYATRWMQRQLATEGPTGNAFRHITLSPEYTVMARIEIGAISTMAQLRACNDWRAIAAEYFDHATPITDMGKRDQAFFDRDSNVGGLIPT